MLQNRCSQKNTSVGVSFKYIYFYRTDPVAAVGNISWTFSLLHLRTMNGVFRGTYQLPSVYFILLRVFRFFLFLFFFWFFLWKSLLFSFEISSLSIFKKRIGVVPRFLSEVSALFSISDLFGLVQFGKNLSYILPALASYNCLQQSISVKLIYHCLYLINRYLFSRCYEKVFEEEKNENKKENNWSATTA